VAAHETELALLKRDTEVILYTLQKVERHLETLNGRTRANEDAILTMKVTADAQAGVARNTAAKWGAGIAAAISGLAVALKAAFGS
jgi:hypothetical protein